MHCRTHTHLSSLWDCLPVHQFTVLSEPLPYECCGCTCQQPHAGPGWALSPPSPASSSPAGLLGLECQECLTLHIKSGTTNFCLVQLCNQHRRRIHMGDPWSQHRRRNITYGFPSVTACPPFLSILVVRLLPWASCTTALLFFRPWRRNSGGVSSTATPSSNYPFQSQHQATQLSIESPSWTVCPFRGVSAPPP